MANTYTPTYNLIKPEVGADTNAWGGHLNTNTDAIDTNMFSRSVATAQTVTGPVTWSAAQTWGAAATFNSTMIVYGATTFDSTVLVTGAATMSSSLSVANNVTASTAPTLGGHLTNKTYVDNRFLPFTGGTLTGNLSVISGTTEMTVTLGSSGGYFFGNATQAGWKASGGSAKVYWDTSGNLTAAANVTAYSDAKLKTNVETIQEALSLVNRMRGVFYDRIDDGQHGVGVIAQEMQEVLPQVVIPNDGVLSVAYGNIVGVLIEAVKELSAKVERLEAGR